MPFSTADTIVAIATPPGRGGIGVVRVSGPASDSIARVLTRRRDAFEPRFATLATVWSADHLALDQAIVTFFPAPASYTGEDVVEFSAHGSPVVLGGIVKTAISAGARLAAPGEFTLRAFLNERIDLAQAEAVADLIEAATPLQARVAFDQLSGTITSAIGDIDRALFDLAARLEASVDFPDEGYHFIDGAALVHELETIIERLTALLAGAARGQLIREGRQVAIVGAPNAGKSSLFNALIGAERAIVTDVPGTTRDLLTEVAEIDGIRLTLVDTAGLRETSEPVESEGVERARRSLDVSDLILFVSDLSRPTLDQAPPVNKPMLRVGTKRDLPHRWKEEPDLVRVSALTGEGLADLRARMTRAVDQDTLTDVPAMTNIRHLALVERARDAMVRAKTAVRAQGASLSEEFVLADLQEARTALEEVTGHRTTDDLLAHVFSRFCIGK